MAPRAIEPPGLQRLTPDMPRDEPPAPPAACNRVGRPLSEVLIAIVRTATAPRISVGYLLLALKDRALGALILVFAAINVMPTPPGTSTVLGIPLIFLAAQLAMGREAPWLPRWISERSLDRLQFTAAIEGLAPWFARAERLFRPRLDLLAAGPAKQLLGVACLLLTAILILPIPFGNMLPALAISVIALAIMERDGAAALVGLAIAGVSVAVVWGIVYAFVVSATILIEHIFGLQGAGAAAGGF